MKAKVTGDGTKAKPWMLKAARMSRSPAAEGTVEAWGNNRMRAL